MNNKLVLGIGAAIMGVVVIGIVTVGGMYVSYNNAESRQRNLIEAKQRDNSSELDNMMKKITQIAEVTNEGKKAIQDFVIGNSQARADGQGKGSLFAMVTEAVPDVNPTSNLFVNLMNTITASRDAWTMRQKELLDLGRVHNDMLTVFPSSFFTSLSGKEKIEIKIVTSTRALDAMESGVDNNIKLFGE